MFLLSKFNAIYIYMQLVFAVFTGEAWGYLGSRKFLQELEMGTDSVNGLNNTLVEQVVINANICNFKFYFYPSECVNLTSAFLKVNSIKLCFLCCKF